MHPDEVVQGQGEEREVTLLLQGVTLPQSSPTAPDLPEVQEQPSSPGPSHETPHVFVEPEDTSGQAVVRNSGVRSQPSGTLAVHK